MIGQRLHYLRKQKKLTQKKVSQDLGIARSTYSGYENDTRYPDYDTLIKIADYFNVSVDYLLGRAEATKDSKNINKHETIDQIVDTLADANELNNEDYKYIAEQVDKFVSYIKEKKDKK